MKFNRIFAVVALATALVATSCEKYDDTEIVNRVEVLEGKVNSIESAISTLSNAVSNKYAVESVEQTANGWTIKFTNGKIIELVNGKDGDAFLKSIEEDDEFVIITLNDENSSIFKLAKDIKVVIGDAESTYVLIDDMNKEVALQVPAIANIVAVSGTVYSSTGSTTDVVMTKANASGWNVKIAKDFSSAEITADESVVKGSRALFVVTITKADGTTYTSSKPLIYFMTDDTAFEQFFAEYEELQKNWTMTNNYINNNEDYAAEKYDALKEEVAPYLNGISQLIESKMTWADESYNAGTLAGDLDEILSTFEEVNIMLTQAMNLFNDGVKAIANDEAFEQFFVEYEQLQKNWTMVNNIVNDEEYDIEALAEAKDDAIFALSGVAQNIETKMTWATESYEEGTLVDDLDEILSTFEEINIQLTQIKNTFDDAVANYNQDKAFEEFDAEYRTLQTNLTQARNVTLGNEENEPYITEKLEEDALFRISSINQMIETKMMWANDSYEKGTLAEDLDEILSTFEEVNIQITQYLNWFADMMVSAKNDAAMQEITLAIEDLQAQLTQMMNSTVYNKDETDWITNEQVESVITLYNAVSQQIDVLKTWAEESWTKGSLVEDINEIYAEFEPIQIEMTQVQNVFKAAVAEAKNNSAFEAFQYEYEMYQKQITDLVKLAGENEAALAAISGVSQNLEALMTWATESYEAGTLFDDYAEIISEFPGIQRTITQIRNTYFND